MELIYQKHKDQYIQENVLLNHKLNDNALLIFIYNYQKLERLRESKPLQVIWC